MERKRVLLAHQKKMLQYLMTHSHFALFAKMRLGKTLPVVRVFSMRPDVKKILVACPYSAFRAWRKEITLEGAGEIVELTGDRETRLGLLNSVDARWYLVNKEGFDVIPELKYIEWDAVLIDESRFISGPKSRVTKFFMNHFRTAKYRGILTGTPAPESELEYFCQLAFCNKKWFGFNDFYIFRAKLFEPTSSYDIAPTEYGRKYIELVLAENCLFMNRQEVGLGEIRRYEQRFCKLPDAAKKIYKSIREKFILEVEGVEIASTIYAPVSHLWMRRLWGGMVDGQFKFHHKLNLLKELLTTELYGESVVVWCHFVDEVNFLAAELSKIGSLRYVHGKHPKLRADREIFINDFQAGRVQWFIGQPECFKHSTDLSRAKTMIFYSSPEGAETREQVEERIISVMDLQPVLYIDLLCDDTAEEVIPESLLRKETRQKRMERTVKKLQQEALQDA